MPVLDQTTSNSYTGNGVTTVFAYTFKLLDEADVLVEVDGVAKTLTTHYTVSGVGNSGGGNITFLSAPANATEVVIQRDMAYLRETDYQDNGDLLAATLDEDIDRVVMQGQQTRDGVARAAKLPVTVTGVDPTLPVPVANRGLKWNAAADGFENGDSDLDAIEAAVAASAAAAASSESAAAASESSANASALSATASASTATTQAGIATTKASEASTSAANALTSENNAETAETNAAASLADALAIYGSIAAVESAASDAAASASAAQTAETNAETAETNAAASAAAAAVSETAADSAYSNSIAIYGSLAAVQSAASSASASAVTAAAEADEATNQAAAAAASALSAASVVSQDLSAIDRTVFSATIVDTFLYDTSKDSDGGAWRKRCAHTSWENETLSGNWLGSAANEAAARAISGATTGSYYYDTTAAGFYTLNAGSGKTITYRGNVRQFPAQVLITVEAARVVLWDLTQAGVPMWMVYSTAAAAAVSMVNGVLIVARNGGSQSLIGFYFVRDRIRRWFNDPAFSGWFIEGISARNGALAGGNNTPSELITNAVQNDVAMTVLPNAPVSVETGLPVPTIAVATAGGVSVIKDSGTVVSSSATDPLTSIAITPLGDLFVGYTSSNAVRYARNIGSLSASFSLSLYYVSSIPAHSNITEAPYKILPADKSSKVAVGFLSKLALLKENPASVAAGMVAYVTKDYNSGWLPGDIRLAALADIVAETKTGGTDTDRSVKANNLTVNGSLTKAAVASGAQLVGYSGFSAANYLEQPYNADLDFGTGDFYIMGWEVISSFSAASNPFNRGLSGSSGGILLRITTAASVEFYGSANTSFTAIALSSTNAVPAGVPVFFTAVRRSGVVYIKLNGETVASAANSTNLTYVNAVTRIGQRIDNVESTNGVLSLWRAGATAPSDEQIKHIYETERPMFEANAQCCLAGTSNTVTALAYDEETDLLHVGTSYGRSAFKGLVRVSSEATPVGAITALAAGAGVIVQGGATAVDVYVPAYTLREELLRDAEQMARFGQNLVAHDFTATASQEVFTLPVGWEIVAVYQQGTLKRETTAWVRTFDGFKWSVDLVTGATVSDWISILAKRV